MISIRGRKAIAASSLFTFVLLGTGIVSPVFAILGEDRATIRSEWQNLPYRHESAVKSGYTVETLIRPESTIHEYFDSDGKIFAVSWRGTEMPDLERLFGRYFQEFQAGLAERRKSVRVRRIPVHLKTEHLVVETGGKPRELWGRAYLHSLLPAGVSEEEIR